MALVQLASGDWFPEELLPIRDGVRYDPTARSGGGAGAPPPQYNVAPAGQPPVYVGYVPPSREVIQAAYYDDAPITALVPARPDVPTIEDTQKKTKLFFLLLMVGGVFYLLSE
jgi:hypothetical protein